MAIDRPWQTSAIWAEKCLAAAARLLVAPASAELQALVGRMVTEHIFAPEIVFPLSADHQQKKEEKEKKKGPAAASTRDLVPLLAPLKLQPSPGDGDEAHVFLPAILRVAIASLDRRRRADPAVVGVLLAAVQSVSLSLDLEQRDAARIDGATVMALVQVLRGTGTALPTAQLSHVVRRLANLRSSEPDAVRWPLVAAALAIDFDCFLHPSAADLVADLFAALSRAAAPSTAVCEVLDLLVDGFVQARDLAGFIARWEHALDQAQAGARYDAWRDDAVARSFGSRVESALTPAAIAQTAARLGAAAQWVVLDALLRGVERQATEAQLARAGALQRTAEAARRAGGDWHAWRVLVRIGGIEPPLLVPAVADAVLLLQQAEGRWPAALFAAQAIVLRLAQDDGGGDESALEGMRTLLHLAAESLDSVRHAPRRWDGRIATVDSHSFGLAVAAAIVGGQLAVLQKADGRHRNAFVDSLLDAALSPATGPAAAAAVAADGAVDARQIFRALVARPALYEHPAIKGIFFSSSSSSSSSFLWLNNRLQTRYSPPWFPAWSQFRRRRTWSAAKAPSSHPPS